MNQSEANTYEQLAEVASRLQHLRTGHAPSSVSVALDQDILVFTLHDALTPVETSLTASPAGSGACKSSIGSYLPAPLMSCGKRSVGLPVARFARRLRRSSLTAARLSRYLGPARWCRSFCLPREPFDADDNPDSSNESPL